MAETTLTAWLKEQEDLIAFIQDSPSTAATVMHEQLIAPNDSTLCCLFFKQCQIDKLYQGQGKVGAIKLINVADQRIILKESNQKLFCRLAGQGASPVKRLTRSASQEYLSSCLGITDSELTATSYLACDEFTNESLMGAILTNYGSFFTVKHYRAGYCHSEKHLPLGQKPKGKVNCINAMEFCDMGNLIDLVEDYRHSNYWKTFKSQYNGKEELVSLLKPKYCLEIFKQLLVALYELQYSFHFTSGDFKPLNILVQSQPIEGDFYGLPLSCPFTCKIADFGKSSLSLNLSDGKYLRIYNESLLADNYFKLDPFTVVEGATSDGVKYYHLQETLVSQVYAKTRHLGLPFFQSYDFYTLVIGLMIIPAYHYIILGTPYLKQTIWDQLWLSDKDNDRALVRCQKAMNSYRQRKDLSFDTIVKVLMDLKLRCDVISHLMITITASYQK